MRKIEELSPITYEDQLMQRKTALQQIIKLKKLQLQRTQQLDNAGSIRIRVHGNKHQFYLVTKSSSHNGKYLPRSQDDFAASIIKHDYNKEVLAAMNKELFHIQQLLNFCEKKSAQKVIDDFIPAKKQLITPLTLSDEEYAAQWLSVPYAGKNFDNTSTEFYTSNGQRVRSKSEVIIADTLTRCNIPYRYEFPLELKTQSFPIYPDFCCLNLRTRQEFYWEHFGIMDDPEYVSLAVNKINSMAASGYLHGYKAIYTFETTSSPLNSRLVEKMIETFLQ